MTERHQGEADEDRLVDALAAQLREAEPPEVDALALVRRSLAHAAASPEGRPVRAVSKPAPAPVPEVTWFRRVPSYVWAAAAMTGLAVGAWMWTPEHTPPASQARSEARELAGGHRVLAASDAEWSSHVEGDALRIDLDRGEALFVVEPLHGGAFVVESAEHRARVVGTVFLVRAAADGFAVEVLEGRVEVDGRMQVPDGDVSGWPASLLGPGRQEAERRGRGAVAAQAPVVPAPSAQEPPADEVPVEATAPPAPEVAPTPTAALPAPNAVRAEPPPMELEDIRGALAARRYESALEAANEALESQPTRASLHQLRGDALRGLGRRNAAFGAYRRAVQHGAGPERASAGLIAARLAEELGRHEDARAMLEQSGAMSATSSVRAAARAFEAELAP